MSTTDSLETSVSKLAGCREQIDTMLKEYVGITDGDKEVVEHVEAIQGFLHMCDDSLKNIMETVYPDTIKELESLKAEYSNAELSEEDKKAMETIDSLVSTMNKNIEDAKRGAEEIQVEYKGGYKTTMKLDLIKKYPSSLYYQLFCDAEKRNGASIYIDFEVDKKYHELLVKYLIDNNDIVDKNNFGIDESAVFCRHLSELNIPYTEGAYNLIYDDYNRYGVGWGNRCIYPTGHKEYLLHGFTKYLNENDKFKNFCKDLLINTFEYEDEFTRVIVPYPFEDIEFIVFMNHYLETKTFDKSLLKDKTYNKESIAKLLEQNCIQLSKEEMDTLNALF